MITYQPKGSMCAACAKKLEDCSKLDFKAMPVMVKLGSVRIVKCIKFKRGLKMFAKLFTVSSGNQVLFMINDNSDGDCGIKITTKTLGGGTISSHLQIDEGDVEEALGRVNQEMAEDFYERYGNKSSLDILAVMST